MLLHDLELFTAHFSLSEYSRIRTYRDGWSLCNDDMSIAQIALNLYLFVSKRIHVYYLKTELRQALW